MKKQLLLILLGLWGLFSCTKDFDEINTNPDVAEAVDPDYLFPTSVLNTVRILENMEYQTGWTYGMYWTESGGAFVNFGTVDNLLQQWWRGFYITTLTGLAKIDEMYAGDPVYNNRVAIARIWESYIYSQMVSFWGPLPFSEAINEDVASGYDSETYIYHTLINDLIANADSLDAGGDTYVPGADLVFAGDLSKWKKFARSLALRLAMQIQDKEKEFAQPVIRQLIAEPGDLVESNADNAIFRWYRGSQQWNPLYNQFIYSPGDRRVNISEFLYMFLAPYEDPRLSVYAEPAATNGEYSGRPINRSAAPSGSSIPVNPHAGRSDNDYSMPGDMWFREDGYSSILTCSEVHFLRAEAAYLGITSEVARNLYYDGIDASLQMLGKESRAEQYKEVSGIKWATFGAGMTDWVGQILPEYAVNSEIRNPYKQIIVQSWLAMYPRGLDAWTLLRRTGILKLPVLFSADPTNNEMPVNAALPERLRYPDEEHQYNQAGNDQGLSFLGNDNLMYAPLMFSTRRSAQ